MDANSVTKLKRLPLKYNTPPYLDGGSSSSEAIEIMLTTGLIITSRLRSCQFIHFHCIHTINIGQRIMNTTMSSDRSTELMVARQLLAVSISKTQEPPVRNIDQSQRIKPASMKPPSDHGNSQVSMSEARQRLSIAKTKELAALKLVNSQRDMLEMMKKNMAVAQSQLESSQRAVKEAMQLLKAAENNRQLRIDENTTVDHSPIQVQFHPSITAHAAQEIVSPPLHQSQQQQSSSLPSSLRSEASSKSRSRSVEPQLKSQLLNLRPEAKMILREVIMSAILHPTGKVDPSMLQHAMKVGRMSKQVIMNAVEVARMRHRKKQMATSRDTSHQSRRVSDNDLGADVQMPSGSQRGRRIPDQARSFVFAQFSNVHNGSKNSIVPQRFQDTILLKKTLPKAA